MTATSFSAVLLAGGKSSRMGTDKAELSIKGQALWLRQLEVLRESGATEIFLSGDPDGPWADWEGPILVDDEAGRGPLSGVITALRRARYPQVLVLAVDMPAMTATVLRKLLAASRQSGAAGAGWGSVPQWKEGFLEPLAAVYPREMLSLAEQCRSAGRLGMQDFAARALEAGVLRAWEIPAEEEAAFANVNSRQDWKDFLSLSPP